MSKGILVLAVVALLAWGQVSGNAADEQIAEQDFYCEMVDEGSWPDYKETYEESCK